MSTKPDSPDESPRKPEGTDDTDTTDSGAAPGTGATASGPGSEPTTATATATDTSAGSPGGAADETADGGADAERGAEEDAREDDGADDALLAPPTAGLFSAETFAIAALLSIGAALIGTRLAEMLMNVSAADQASAVTAMILGDGGTALLGVFFGLLSLGLTTEYSRPWARWGAMAAVVVGIFFLAASAYVFTQVPAPAPGF
ncbi:hypothetical protein HNR23_000798 [Nocardiopsis mwathae]|uniref:Uncharacterized protein n=1 Tax=Nocardiopsis mwathae TaxID=1472723 RepID=A0A7W9YEK5_9ACTN|nr:hypothetical protein [Nocardiopsis mwathae]MBB6170738.1 hypothetical protein [Nocardiopsis mwathae]